MDTKQLQIALKGLGFDPGPVDGAFGRLTIAALKAYQPSQHLTADGVAGLDTLARLFPSAAATLVPTPPWYEEALRLKGVHETEGGASNPVILDWARHLSAWVANVYKSDATPWCGLFVGHVMAATLPSEPLPSNPLSALAWRTFGKPLAKRAIGAVCVFSRTGGGHVALYVGEDADALHVLGGNQSDSVDVTRVAKERLVAVRWPVTFPMPTGGPVAQAALGGVSRNEA